MAVVADDHIRYDLFVLEIIFRFIPRHKELIIEYLVEYLFFVFSDQTACLALYVGVKKVILYDQDLFGHMVKSP
jgi:hypothetical protein